MAEKQSDNVYSQFIATDTESIVEEILASEPPITIDI